MPNLYTYLYNYRQVILFSR